MSSGSKKRIFISSFLQFIWSALITICMFMAFEKAKKNTDWNIKIFGAWTGVTCIIQIIVFGFSLNRKHLKSINISLLTFILCNMCQYGFGLYYSYQNSKPEHQGKTCVNLETDMSSYVVFLTTLPVMIISNMLYPFPTEERDWKTMVQSGFTMLDFLDMGEFIFSEFGCFITYDNRSLIFFYMVIGISAILLPLNRGLESWTQSHADGKNEFDCTVTVLNMLFYDGLCFLLRVYVMAKEKHVYFALIFVIKEIGVFVLRLTLVGAYCKTIDI